MSEEAEMIRRDLITYGGIFALSYVVFMWHFYSNAEATRTYAVMLSAPHHANAMPAEANASPRRSTGSNQQPVIDINSADHAVAKSPVGTATPIQVEDQPYYYEPVTPHVDAASQLAAYSTLMSDPDPEVARIARDAYASIMESR